MCLPDWKESEAVKEMVSVVTFSLTPQDVLRGVLQQIGLMPLISITKCENVIRK